MAETEKIAILIDARLHNELVLRTRNTKDVTVFIENALLDFLERTEYDTDLWDNEYLQDLPDEGAISWASKYGAPGKGYQWQSIFLPNSTKLKMTYKGLDHFSEIRHGKIMDEAKERSSPSDWVAHVANFTSRNAWRDIYVQLPGESNWKLADVIRSKAREKNHEQS